jgi:uncharacterized protein (DUF849 family)
MARAVLLKACFNGDREGGGHAALPLSPAQLAEDRGLVLAGPPGR